jgi:hypothetical protein
MICFLHTGGKSGIHRPCIRIPPVTRMRTHSYVHACACTLFAKFHKFGLKTAILKSPRTTLSFEVDVFGVSFQGSPMAPRSYFVSITKI